MYRRKAANVTRSFKAQREVISLRYRFSLIAGLFKRWRAVALFAIIALLVINIGFIVPPASAKTFSAMTPRERALSYAYAVTLDACLKRGAYRDGSLKDRIKNTSALEYRFFWPYSTAEDTLAYGKYDIGAGYLLEDMGVEGHSGDGNVYCGVDQGATPWLKNALTLWGWATPLDFLCGSPSKEGVGGTRVSGDEGQGLDCRNGTAWFQPLNTDNVMRVIKKEVYGGGDITLGSAGEYVYNLGIFYQGCLAGDKYIPTTTISATDPRLYADVKVVEGGAVEEVDYYGRTGSKARTEKVNYKPTGFIPCQEVVDRINGGGGAADYALWAKANPDQATADASVGAGQDGDAAGATSTCNIEGIGWIVCPVLKFVADISDLGYTFLANYFLSTDSRLVTDPEVMNVWSRFKDIANIAFVIVFLFIIYSQVTSVAISNYGIKRMLPRLIIGAILVNISIYICQFAVDISNILGYGVVGFFNSIPVGEQLASGMDLSTGIGDGRVVWGSVIGALLIAGLAVAGIALAVGGGVLLASLLAVFMIVLILVGRQAAIVLLVIVSPLAFVAYLLPNTESLFKKWYKAFSTLLLLFPIIGAVFGASRLAAHILSNMVGQTSDPKYYITQVIALGVSVIPFFVVPGLLKGSLTAIGAIGAKMQGYANKATGAAGSAAKATAKERYGNSTAGRYQQYRKDKSRKDRSLVQAGAYRGRNPLKKMRSNMSNAFNTSPLSGGFGDKTAAAGAAAASKLEQEEVENEIARMGKASKGPTFEKDEATQAYEEALHSGNVVKARAAQKILLSKGSAGVEAIRGVVGGKKDKDGKVIHKGLDGVNNSATDYARSDLAAAGIKSKDAGLNSWSYDREKRALGAIDAEATTYSGLTDSELAGQSKDVLNNAVTAGLIGRDRATAMLDNETIAAQLSEDKKKVLRDYVARTARPVNVPPSTNTPPPTAPPPPPTTPPTAPPSPPTTPPTAPPPPPTTPPTAPPPPPVNTPGPV